LPETRSISDDRACLALSSGIVLSKNNIEILSFGPKSGYFWSKSSKKIKNLKIRMEAVRILDFVLRKTYHTPPEYPGYDGRI
jgi:hypothetical protein